MKKKTVLVVGCNTEKGQNFCRLVKQSNDLEVAAGFGSDTDEEQSFPIFANWEDFSSWYGSEEDLDFPDIEVIVDFSEADNSIEMLNKFASIYDIPAVITTSGFDEDDLLCITFLASDFPIFISEDLSEEDALEASRYMIEQSGNYGRFSMDDLQ